MSLTIEEQATRVDAIYRQIPGLMALRHDFRRDHYEPIGVVLPAALNPGNYEGPDVTEAPATLMGLPVTWGDCTGLIYGGHL